MRALSIVAAVVLAAGGVARAEPPPPPAAGAAVSPRSADVSLYGRLPSVSHLALSPDGALLAAATATPTGDFVAVRDLASGKTIKRMNFTGTKLRALRWLDEDRLLFEQSKTEDIVHLLNPREEWSLASVVNLKTGRTQNVLDDPPMTTDEPRRLNTVVGAPTLITDRHGDKTLYALGHSFVGHHGVLTIYAWWEGRSRLILQGGEDTVGFAFTPSGDIVGRIDYEKRSGRWSIFAGPEPFRFKRVASGETCSDFRGSPAFPPTARTSTWPTETPARSATARLI